MYQLHRNLYSLERFQIAIQYTAEYITGEMVLIAEIHNK